MRRTMQHADVLRGPRVHFPLLSAQTIRLQSVQLEPQPKSPLPTDMHQGTAMPPRVRRHVSQRELQRVQTHNLQH